MQWIRRWPVHAWTTHEKLLLRYFLATLLSLALVWKIVSPIPTIVDGHFYDRVLASFPVLPESDIQIISIDEESIQKIGPWPWPEAVHTKFLEQLARQAPKGVVINFSMGLPKQTEQDDAAAELALRKLPVFISVQAFPSPAVEKHSDDFLARRKRFASAVAGVGHSSLAPDGAIERLRFIRLFAQANGRKVPYVGALFNPGPAVQQAITEGTNLYLGIPFHGELSHPSISYSDVLEGKLLPDQLKGRTIVVGPSRNVALGSLAVLWYVSSDSSTGTGTGTTTVSSTEVHASAIDALQQGNYILTASPLVRYLTLAIPLFFMFFAFDKLPKAAPLMAIAFVGIGFAVSALMLRLFRLWIPPSFFVLGIVPAYLLWSWQNMRSVLGFFKEHITALSRVPVSKLDVGRTIFVKSSDPVERHIGALDHAIVRLVRLEAFMRYALQKLPIALLLCRADGTIAVSNVAAEELLAELLPAASSTTEESLPALIARLEAKEGKPRTNADLHWSQALVGEYKTPRGKIFKIDATRIGEATDAAPVAWIVLLRELTQERQAERERADWLNFLWHDLRSPQINLLSLVELFEMRPSRLGVTELVTGVRHEAERTMALAQNFISVTTSEAREYEFNTVRLSSLLEASVEAVSSYATARSVRVLSGTATAGNDLIRADGGMLTRVLANLMENAIRHSPPGTTIRVCCSVDPAGEAVVAIQDEGTGITPALLEALLDLEAPTQNKATNRVALLTKAEVVYSSKSHGASTHGFGFVLVRQVVAAHGGWISGWSMEGVGTTFAIGLPLQRRPADPRQ